MLQELWGLNMKETHVIDAISSISRLVHFSAFTRVKDLSLTDGVILTSFFTALLFLFTLMLHIALRIIFQACKHIQVVYLLQDKL